MTMWIARPGSRPEYGDAPAVLRRASEPRELGAFSRKDCGHRQRVRAWRNMRAKASSGAESASAS